jgi:hypothetical protein
MTVFYVRPKTGNDAAAGTTPATAWRSLTLGALATRIAPGDEIRIEESGAPTLAGNAQWTNTLPTVTKAAASNVDIFDCSTAWTAAAVGVTSVTTGTRKQGTLASSITVPNTVVAGLIAYKALAAPVDASAYQQVCFWIRPGAALAANVLRLDLCTDAAGATPAQSITIPYALGATTWTPIVVDTGGALSGAIRSVALRALGQLGAGSVAVIIDNIFAAKAPGAADEITLHSLISKNLVGEPWYPIQSVSGATILLDGAVATTVSATFPAYGGATALAATWVKQTMPLPPALTLQAIGVTYTADTPWGLINDSGTSVAPITISGGWDSATMLVQASETILNGVTGFGQGVNFNGQSWVNISKLGFANTRDAFTLNGTYNTLTDVSSYRIQRRAVQTTSDGASCKVAAVTGLRATGAADNMVNVSNGTVKFVDTLLATIDSASSAGTQMVSPSGAFSFDGLVCWDMAFVMETQKSTLVRGGSAKLLRNAYDFQINGTQPGVELTVCDFVFFNPTKVNVGAGLVGLAYSLRLQDQNLTPNSHITQVEDGTITPDNTFFRVGAQSWRIAPSGSTRTSTNPIIFPLGPLWKLLSPPAVAQAVSVYVYRDNANIQARLRIPAGQLCTLTGGDLTAVDAGAPGAWNQITIPITMTQDGAIDAQLEVYTLDGAGGYNCWTDDLS